MKKMQINVCAHTIGFLLVVFLFGTIDLGCGTKTGSGLTPTGDITVRSQAFGTGRLAYASDDAYQERLLSNITDFKFCVTKLKLEQEDGASGGEVEFKPGLIDVSSGEAKTWGTAALPTTLKLKRIKVEVHKDQELCSGASYSVKFNSVTTSKDVEFVFKFEPAIEVKAGGTVNLALTTIATTLREAADANQLNDESLKEFIEGVEGTGSGESD